MGANTDVQIRHVSETIFSATGSTENRAVQQILEGAVGVAAASLWGNGTERGVDSFGILVVGPTRLGGC